MTSAPCPICAAGTPQDVLVELESTWVSAPRLAPLAGYLCVVAKQHVEEPFELRGEARSAFWDECMLVAEAVHGALRPLKLNYEIHGNTIPHLHLHLFPRTRDDAFWGGPIDGRSRAASRSEADLARLAQAIEHRRLGRDAAP